ncbi:MAG: hypothetical protein RL254_1227 [Planctomycetota bacterium]
MAYTQAQLASIETAIASGTLTVRMADRLVTYQSLAELIRLRDMMRGELGVSPPSASRGRVWSPTISSGL